MVKGLVIQTATAAEILLHLKSAAKKTAMGIWKPMVGVIPIKRPRANPSAISLGLPLIFRNLSYARFNEEFKLPLFSCCFFILGLIVDGLMTAQIALAVA